MSRYSVDVSSELEKYFGEYSSKVQMEVIKVGEDSSKKLTDDLKATSPRDADRKPSRVGKKRYANGWTATREDTGVVRGRFVIHNKNEPTLTHLLEDGHVKFVYGRPVGGRVAGKPHIKPARDRAMEEYEASMIRRLDRIG